MNLAVSLTPKRLLDYLLNVGITRPVFIWGPPGIGKSAIVEQFANSLGLVCVSLLGSQLAPEDIIGIPQIVDGKSRFCPPTMIARDEAYCLFLDELNACSLEVQKAFYSLIHERRIGEYYLPNGSIVIGAGNRAQDSAIVKPMSSALINRMNHVELKVSAKDWLEWAYTNGIHPWVLEYIQLRPRQLWSQPSKEEIPFSTPRSWHALSDGLISFGDEISDENLSILAHGYLSPEHAGQFRAFVRMRRSRYQLNSIIKGEGTWPGAPEERDVLYFLAQSFRDQLIKELPRDRNGLKGEAQDLAYRAKILLKDLASLSLEIAQMVVTPDGNDELPAWFLAEVIRDLPRLVEKRSAA